MKDTIPPLWHVPVVDKVRSNGTKSKAKLNQIWGVAQWLSIDVSLGAICSCAMMYKVMGVTPLPGYQLLILGGTVQLIYTLDHLWDVQHMQMVPITERHIFHWRFKPQL
jgi:hypothetical protein